MYVRVMPASLRFPLTTLSTVIIIIIFGPDRTDWSAVVAIKVEIPKFVDGHTHTHTPLKPTRLYNRHRD